MNTFINSLQNSQSYETYVKDYLNTSLSALANSGQRFNIKSTGIKYVDTTLADILGLKTDSNQIAELSIDTDKYELSVKTDYTEDTTTSIKFSNTLYFDNDNDKFDNIRYIFSHIDQFSNDSYILFHFSISLLFLSFIKFLKYSTVSLLTVKGISLTSKLFFNLVISVSGNS